MLLSEYLLEYMELEVVTNSSQYKSASIVNLVLAVPLDIHKTNEVYNLDM